MPQIISSYVTVDSFQSGCYLALLLCLILYNCDSVICFITDSVLYGVLLQAFHVCKRVGQNMCSADLSRDALGRAGKLELDRTTPLKVPVQCERNFFD